MRSQEREHKHAEKIVTADVMPHLCVMTHSVIVSEPYLPLDFLSLSVWCVSVETCVAIAQ